MSEREIEISPYAQALFASDAKVGKTCSIIAGALGVLPWQKSGGVVTSPEDLHVFMFDAGTVDGVESFLLETCKAPSSALKFTKYQYERKVLDAAFEGKGAFPLYSSILADLQSCADRVRQRQSVGVVHISSYTGLAEGLLAALSGAPDGRRGGGMDMDKWGEYGRLMAFIQKQARRLDLHVFYEAHVAPDQDGNKTLTVSGKTAQRFPVDLKQIFELKRKYGQPYASKDGKTKTNCDVVALNTRPTFQFVANGRNFNERLEAEEYDLTAVFQKLGLKTGGWKP